MSFSLKSSDDSLDDLEDRLRELLDCPITRDDKTLKAEGEEIKFTIRAKGSSCYVSMERGNMIALTAVREVIRRSGFNAEGDSPTED